MLSPELFVEVFWSSNSISHFLMLLGAFSVHVTDVLFECGSGSICIFLLGLSWLLLSQSRAYCVWQCELITAEFVLNANPLSWIRSDLQLPPSRIRIQVDIMYFMLFATLFRHSLQLSPFLTNFTHFLSNTVVFLCCSIKLQIEVISINFKKKYEGESTVKLLGKQDHHSCSQTLLLLLISFLLKKEIK